MGRIMAEAITGGLTIGFMIAAAGLAIYKGLNDMLTIFLAPLALMAAEPQVDQNAQIMELRAQLVEIQKEADERAQWRYRFGVDVIAPSDRFKLANGL